MSETGQTAGQVTSDATSGGARAAATSIGRHLWNGLTVSPVATLGGGIIVFWALMAVLAPWLAPYPPNQMDPMALVDPYPSATHWLGTDQLGRDMLSRIMWGARTVLLVAPIAVLGAAIVGTMLGLIAGYRGGIVDTVVMRVGDVLLAFPQIILYLIILAKFGASALNIILVITVTKAPIIARIVRAVTLDVKNRDYVAAARMRGESTLHILLVEILPNARGPLIVDFFLRLGYTTIAIGVLGFLGIGLPPPDPDWGGMIKESYGLIFVYPHMTLIPAVAVSSLVVGFNFLATGLREASLDD